MLDREGRLEAEVDDLRTARDAYANEKRELYELVAALQAVLDVPLTGEQDDTAAFGRNAWVYCKQHMKAHQTGWCGVSPRDKIGLGVDTAEAAYAKCRDWGFELYKAN